MSALRETLSPRMKRLTNPSNKTLRFSVADNSNPMDVLQALIKRFGGSRANSNRVVYFKLKKSQ